MDDVSFSIQPTPVSINIRCRKLFFLDNNSISGYPFGMENTNTAPHTDFRKLIDIADDMRRKVFKEANQAQQKKIMGLTVRQGGAVGQLKTLTEQNPDGVALKTLAKHLQMTIPATSLLVEAMVSKGLFERTPNPNDRRAVCIRLSAKGLALFADMYSHMETDAAKLFTCLTPEEADNFSRIITKLHSNYFGRE